MKIKQKFPTEEHLRSFIDANIDEITASVKEEVHHLEADYIQAKKNHFWGFALLMLGIISWIAYFGFVSIIISIIFFVLAGKLQSKAREPIQNFNRHLNALVFTKVFEIFDLTASVVPVRDLKTQSKIAKFLNFSQQMFSPILSWGQIDSLSGKGTDQRTLDLLDASELITEPRNHCVSDDSITVLLDKGMMHITELDIQNVTGSGGEKRFRRIFHGYFFAVDISKTLVGKTFVTTKGDILGYGNKSSFGRNDVSRTELEWNDFENKIHVSTTDPIEARYILTTDFMTDLYDWWNERVEKQIRISFIGDKMYFIYPDLKIRLHSTFNKVSKEEISEYMESICVPLLHSLYLVEDVTK